VSRLAGLRLWFLGIVNALILLHIILYYAFGRTSVGCIDFFGFSTFAGLGLVTSGSVFLAILVISTLLFGRIFCGWGCHFAFFQDILSRSLSRIGFRATFRRSRLEYVVPPLLFVFTLLYPVVAWWRDRGFPQDVSVDLAYPEVWHLLPGAKGVLLILLVDVVVLTLLFGSRAFCRYLCPYGLSLKFFHALAPLRVVKRGTCSDCGACAPACPAGVPIKFEIDRFGVIHDLNCMNCGDCVAACPSGALAMRLTKRAYARTLVTGLRLSPQRWWVDVTLLVFTVAGLVVYRGREFGDFLSAGLGLVVGGAVIVAVDPRRLAPLSLARRLRRYRAITVAVAAYLTIGLLGQAVGVAALRNADAAFEREDFHRVAHEYARGRRAHDALKAFVPYLDNFDDRARGRAPTLKAAADSAASVGRWRDAEMLCRAVLAADNTRIGVHGDLGTALFNQGRFWDAARCYLEVLRYDPNDLVALYHLAMTRIQLGQRDEAVQIVQKILSIDNVGNALDLIRSNPIFRLLNNDPRYSRVMSLYQSGGGRSPLDQGGRQ
jgi:polyferredoxin